MPFASGSAFATAAKNRRTRDSSERLVKKVASAASSAGRTGRTVTVDPSRSTTAPSRWAGYAAVTGDSVPETGAVSDVIATAATGARAGRSRPGNRPCPLPLRRRERRLCRLRLDPPRSRHEDRCVDQLHHPVGDASEEHARRVGKAARSHDDEVRALLRRSVHDRVRDVAGRAVHELAPGLDARLVRLLHGLGDEPRLLRRALDHVRRRAAAVVLGDVDDEELRVELLRHLDRDWERLPGAPRSVDGHHDVVEHSHHLDADGRGGRGAGVGPAGPSQRADRPFEHYETVTLERCAGITYGAASRTRPRPQARMIHVITIVWF